MFNVRNVADLNVLFRWGRVGESNLQNALVWRMPHNIPLLASLADVIFLLVKLQI